MGSRVLRSCVVCRASVEQDQAIRLVCGPDGLACVDWRRKLPGRGASVCWKRSCLEGVRQSGRLKRALRDEVGLPDGDWPLGFARNHLSRRQRELAGLANRAGELKSGGNLVGRSLKTGWPTYLGLAVDSGQTVSADWQRRAAGREVEVHRSVLSAEDLGLALGKSGPRSVFAVGSGPLGAALRTELKRGPSLL